MNEPTTFRAGDSASWSESIPDYPASAGWVLKYRMLWPTGTGAAIPTTANGDDHVVSLSSTDTAPWLAGLATLVRWVEKGAARVTLGQLSVNILPDLTQAVTHDGRTANKKALDAAEAALAAYAAGGKACVAEYTIGDKAMKFRDTQQILDLIQHYKRLVAKENAALAILGGSGVPGRVHYRG